MRITSVQNHNSLDKTFLHTTVDDCALIHMDKIDAESGLLNVVDNEQTALPFSVKRLFYIYDVPAGESRGAHAHIQCHQLIIAATGAFQVSLFDGTNEKTISLNQPFIGLHIPPGIWAAEIDFSYGSTCLVLASEAYDEYDYIRKMDEYLKRKSIELQP